MPSDEPNSDARPVLLPLKLWILLALYCCASLIHFIHNAEFANEYPNLPAWITRSNVYFAWLAITAVGVTGLLAIGLKQRIFGLLLLTIYALLGFAGLDHYFLAPVSAHTFSTNITILFEVMSAAVLLMLLVSFLLQTGKPVADVKPH